MVNDRRYLYFDDKHWEDGFKVLEILLKNGYKTAVRNEEHSLIIEYDYNDDEIAYKHLEWLDDEEAEAVDSFRWHRDNDGAENSTDN